MDQVKGMSSVQLYNESTGQTAVGLYTERGIPGLTNIQWTAHHDYPVGSVHRATLPC